MEQLPVQRWRLAVRHGPGVPAVSQRDATDAWEAALRASGLPLVTTDAEGVRPKVAFGVPAGGQVAAEADLVDLWLTQRLPIADVRAAIAGCLPAGCALVDLHDVWLGEPALPGRVVASDVRAVVRSAADAPALATAAAALLDASALPRRRTKGERAVEYDLRPFVVDLAVEPGAAGRAEAAADGNARCILRMRLAHDPSRGIGRPDEVIAEVAERAGAAIEVVELVRERLHLATGGRTGS